MSHIIPPAPIPAMPFACSGDGFPLRRGDVLGGGVESVGELSLRIA
jgi:hypothetical protein